MKSRPTFLALLLLISATVLRAQQPAPDPLGENLFPPELIMQHQQALGLSEEQKNFFKNELRQAQTRFTELQWKVQDEAEKMAELIKQPQVDESQVLSQLDKILNLERDVKRAQIALLIRIKNRLTPEQQAKLREIRNRQR
jgi:Spy/CpxP family protein refolding chaperone